MLLLCFTLICCCSLISGQVLAAGRHHFCAVQPNNEVYCWGRNTNGALGDGTTINRSTPVKMMNIGSATHVSAGEDFTCVVDGGAAKCIGSNSGYKLGDGTTTSRSTVALVSGLSTGVSKVSCGKDYGCALLTSGAMKCWGSDSNYGKLGDGSGSSQSQPSSVSGFETNGVAKMATGVYHTCIVTTSGAVMCSGDNSSGQLGDNTLVKKLVMTQVSGLTSQMESVSVGESHSCALKANGLVYCWGYNYNGQLGNGVSTTSMVPVNPIGISGAVFVQCGSSTTAVVLADGTAKVFGENKLWFGPANANSNYLSPVSFSNGVSGISELRIAFAAICINNIANENQCLGEGWRMQLGNGQDDDSLVLVDVLNLPMTHAPHFVVTQVPSQNPTSSITSAPTPSTRLLANGKHHFCSLQINGQVFCWGRNSNGALGDGTTTNRATPVQMQGVSAAKKVSAGDDFTCIVEDGAAKCIGSNAGGRLGDGTTTSRNTLGTVSGLSSGVSNVICGSTHACALLLNGGMKCWGSVSFMKEGALGNGLSASSSVPVAVSGFESSGVSSISAGVTHTCIVSTLGAALCTGYNYDGQIGDGTTVNKLVLTQVVGLTTNVVAISAGESHTCALQTGGGGVTCWGLGFYGALGNGGTASSSVPVTPIGLSNVVSIHCGFDVTAVIHSSGAVSIFGINKDWFGPALQEEKYLSPVSFSGGLTGNTEVRPSFAAICTSDASGYLRCIGEGWRGQLGNGLEDDSVSLVYVLNLPLGAPQATVHPSNMPTKLPTAAPIVGTIQPTVAPNSVLTTNQPTLAPNGAGTTIQPTVAPNGVETTVQPTLAPNGAVSTIQPTVAPISTDASSISSSTTTGVAAGVSLSVLFLLAGLVVLYFKKQRKLPKQTDVVVVDAGAEKKAGLLDSDAQFHPKRRWEASDPV